MNPSSSWQEKLPPIAIIGAGPAGLMAAEKLAERGLKVVIFERMASPARKFLMAGRGGLNITHSEPLESLLDRYRPRHASLENAIRAFPPAALIEWTHGLGQETFTGTSGRIFPKSLKASPLLRAWLRRLDGLGVTFNLSHRWTGWDDQSRLTFATPAGEATAGPFAATLLALGGASWPRLGSDGSWVSILERSGVPVTPLAPANAGVTISWSPFLRERFAGTPLKRIALSLNGITQRGEVVITKDGLEGGAIYALSHDLREAFASGAPVRLTLDLRPDDDVPDLTRKITGAPAKQSLANTLRKSASLSPAAIALLREPDPRGLPKGAMDLARLIKELPLTVTGFAGMERAISSAGGVRLDALDPHFMLRARPGVFAAGEMLDWEAPTGGYLLQACLGTGVSSASGIADWLLRQFSTSPGRQRASE